MREYIAHHSIQQSSGKWIHIASYTSNSAEENEARIAAAKASSPQDVAKFETRVVNYSSANYLKS